MKLLVSVIVLMNLLSATFGCQQYTDSVQLIDRLNDFYGFDHNIFVMDSVTDFGGWIRKSPSISVENFIPQTVYTVEDFADKKITDAAALTAISGKSPFLIIVVVDTTNLNNGSQLLTQIKIVRRLNVNVKIGVFFDRSITSLDTVEQLFRWCWSAGIVNIFSAFHLQVEEPFSFNVFKYDPFGTFDLINVTRNESIQEYFSDKWPNYRKHPIRFLQFPKLNVSVVGNNFWNTVLGTFNASMSLIRITDQKFTIEDLDKCIIFQEIHVEGTMSDLTYPHRQMMVETIVPHAKPYSDFVAYLRNRTWTLIFAYTFVVISLSSILLAVSGYFQKRKVFLFQCVADVVNLLINDNSAIKYRNLSRADIIVVVPLTFTGLIVMNGIVSIFQSYITAPIYQPQINSFSDLYTSTVPIMADEIGWKNRIVKLLESLTRYGGWNSRVFGVKFDQLTSEMMKFNDSIVFFVDNRQASVFLDVQKKLALKAFHLLGEHFLYKLIISFKVSSDFPFTERVNDIGHRLNGAGLTNKWEKDENEYMAKEMMKLNLNRQINEGTSIGEFAVPTAIWFGWIASVVVFICEILWKKIRSNPRF